MARSPRMTEKDCRELFLALRFRPDWARSILDQVRVQQGHLGYDQALVEARRQGVSIQALADAFRITPTAIKTMVRRAEQKMARDENHSRLLAELQSRDAFDLGPAAEYPIDDIGLPARARNALVGQGIKTIGQLVSMDERDVLALDDIGRKTLRDIRDALANCGLSLGMRFGLPKEGFSQTPRTSR